MLFFYFPQHISTLIELLWIMYIFNFFSVYCCCFCACNIVVGRRGGSCDETCQHVCPGQHDICIQPWISACKFPFVLYLVFAGVCFSTPPGPDLNRTPEYICIILSIWFNCLFVPFEIKNETHYVFRFCANEGQKVTVTMGTLLVYITPVTVCYVSAHWVRRMEENVQT